MPEAAVRRIGEEEGQGLRFEKTDNPGNEDWITTGEAADALSVTPDTVLKWIKQGKLAARRTVGGHHRIEAGAIERLRMARARGHESQGQQGQGLHCWEYFSTGAEVREECTECAAYRVRAGLCFELRRLDATLSCQKLFCQSACEDCPYYQQVHRMPLRILAITPDASIPAEVEACLQGRAVVRAAHSVYGASAQIGELRPSIVLIDSALPREVADALIQAISSDGRVPWVRLFVIGADPFWDFSLPSLSRSSLGAELLSLLADKPVEGR